MSRYVIHPMTTDPRVFGLTPVTEGQTTEQAIVAAGANVAPMAG